jgi:hypothetical protein
MLKKSTEEPEVDQDFPQRNWQTRRDALLFYGKREATHPAAAMRVRKASAKY